MQFRMRGISVEGVTEELEVETTAFEEEVEERKSNGTAKKFVEKMKKVLGLKKKKKEKEENN